MAHRLQNFACLLGSLLLIQADQPTTVFSILHEFAGGADGGAPNQGQIADAGGNLYGTTFYGGSNPACSGCGTVFELIPPPAGKTKWTKLVLYSFAGGMDGAYPAAGLAIDTKGNLYGTTEYGGGPNSVCSSGCGTIFKLAPPSAGSTTWSEAVLYRFSGASDGGQPFSPVIVDGSGNLYGTSYYYGNTSLPACMPTPLGSQPFGCGLVYELSPPITGQTAWTQTVLHTFTDSPDGGYPAAGLIAGANGNLYGTTAYGGDEGFYGTVFELIPPRAGGTQWHEKILHSFDMLDGYFPFDPLAFGPGGIYGTTRFGGDACEGIANGCGVVFKLSYPPTGSTAWSLAVIHKFLGGQDGAYPIAGVVLDSSGLVLGTTDFGGGGACVNGSGLPDGCGTIYELTPPVAGSTNWREIILHRFSGKADGKYPDGGLLLDPSGNASGNAPSGGTLGFGTAFSFHRG